MQSGRKGGGEEGYYSDDLDGLVEELESCFDLNSATRGAMTVPF